MGQPTRVYLVRHGQSTFNAEERYQGRNDEPVLTESGVEAAAITGRHLASIPFDGVISSPLRRAHQTATIVAASLAGSPAVETHEDLRELDLGIWQGLSVDVVRQRFPADYRVWREHSHNFRISDEQGREFYPVRELFGQAERFWRELLPRYAGKQVLIVTHGGTARALTATAAGIGIERFQSLHMGNCGISIVEFGSEGGRIEAWNLTEHVGDYPLRRGLRALLFSPEFCPERNGIHADFVFTGDGPPESWHAAARNRMRTGALTTGMFVGPAPVLSEWLSLVLGINHANSPWKPLAHATLHYRESGASPVVRSFRADRISGLCSAAP